MTNRMRCVFVASVTVALLAASAASNLARAGVLSVCVDTSSPGHAMDQKVANAVARQLGDQLEVYHFDGSGDDEGFALKLFRRLLDQHCALVMGFPMETAANTGTPPGTHATAAYARTGFVLVTSRHGGASTLSELAKGAKVAVTYQTAPNLYFIDHPGLQADVYLNDEHAIKALDTGKVHAAMLWRPTVAHALVDERGRFAEHRLDEPHANFHLVALYTDPAVARHFDDGITALQRSCSLRSLLEPYADPVAAQESAEACAKPKKMVTHPQPAKLSALYTVAQAKLGRAKFEDKCSMCHGPNLEGRAGPALRGANFASVEADFHVSDIFTILVNNMPATQPGSLPHEDYVSIMAFLLQENGYPSGKQKLTYDGALHSKTMLLYHGK